MKKKKSPKAPVSGMDIIPHSGGENSQLKGFDASDRVIASPTGATRTADIISRPGPHVPVEKPWTATLSDYYEVNSGSKSRSDSNNRKGKK
jgi:hypothetical protein